MKSVNLYLIYPTIIIWSTWDESSEHILPAATDSPARLDCISECKTFLSLEKMIYPPLKSKGEN